MYILSYLIFSKKAWSAIEAPQNVRFCGSRQHTTLFARWYYAREDFAALILRLLCVSIALYRRAFYTIKPINMRSKYDQGVPVAFVVRLGRLPYTSDTLMALCSIKAPRIDRFLHSSTVIRCHGPTYLAMLQQSRLPSPKKASDRASYSRSRKQREEDGRRPKRFWVRVWLTDERRLQFGHYGQLKLTKIRGH